MDYREQYRRPQWQRRRLERLEAAGYACEECCSTELMLHVHHKRYVRDRMVWEYADDELVVLCENCHAGLHSARHRLAEVVSCLSWFDLEALLGYAKGLHLQATASAESPACYELDVESSHGIADAYQLPRDLLWEITIKTKGSREVTGRSMRELSRILAEECARGEAAIA